MDFFPHTIYPNHTAYPPSTPPSYPNFPCTPDSQFLYFLFSKDQASKRQHSNSIKQDTIRQNKRLHIEAGHGNPTGGNTASVIFTTS